MEYDAHGMHTTHKLRPIKTGIHRTTMIFYGT